MLQSTGGVANSFDSVVAKAYLEDMETTNTAAPARHPRVRIRRLPVFTFAEWMANRHPGIELARETDVAELIGGAMLERTRHGRGKLRAPGHRLMVTARFVTEFDAAVAGGEIPSKTVFTPLRSDSRADAAYERVTARRAARRSVTTSVNGGSDDV